MNALRRVKKYLENCGIACSAVQPCDLSAEYPVFIATRYDVARIELLGEQFIVIEPKVETSPEELLEAYRTISAAHHVLIVLDFADREYSESLQRGAVNYVVPGRQVYLPPYAILTPPEAYERSAKTFLRNMLSPWAQVVFLRVLLFHSGDAQTSYAVLRRELPVNAVSLCRACQELAYHQLARLEKDGRARMISLPSDRRLLWDRARTCLRSPVVRRLRYLGDLKTLKPMSAGYSALVSKSDLAEDGECVYAISSADAKALDLQKIRKYQGTSVEVWRYDPRLLASGECVDPLSLVLSMRDSADARVQIALDNLLEKVL